ncbi:DHH family phosphoesterase [Tissierella praeacuta]|uniref:Cyclic-di-AMP phosphodiesterase n=1 Tax=Tissierella praeacuta DSM 18095 TaxID=1123404 RepID=A0A1M4Y368_9FIRM|nr:DHH family phosphoesterase [Tissierella praeacuta]TCU79493.1 c-di-AMP phosphodiesterase-like protein [Tissierella praeacuta]SHF00267.1 c-di-AMP phosphodiesterase, consists of a GGDEF-like and DHH domains [Tissierella praeacuta DSM 18095]SUO98876.1 Bifunctional oligoribonuclease and PAP phosphatase nrnA [Tissierella praeacuta]
MKNKKILLWQDSYIYLIAIGVLVIILSLYQPILSVLGIILIAYLIIYNIKSANKKEKEFQRYIEGLGDEFESATKHAIFNMPFPLVMLDENGNISWYNTPFLKLMGEIELLNEKLSDLIPGLNLDSIFKENDMKPLDIKYGDRDYKVYPNLVDTKKTNSTNNMIVMLYWVDNTNLVNLEQRYNKERLVIALAYVDNYDDVKSSTPEVNRPLVMAEIDKNINSYFTKYNGVVRKYENDKYFIIIENSGFKNVESKKFDILDQIRELDLGNTIPITLSMGVGAGGSNPFEAYEKARAAIDIALGRGGDQAVVQVGSQLSFYGGKTKAIEKRNKVKARVIGYALRQLIDQADRVFVMGHKNPDMDSFGAGVGVLRAVKDRNKEGYLILNGENPSIKNIYDRMLKEQPELLEQIVTSEKGLELVNDSSLMVVVDNHKPSFTEAPELLDLISKVVVIDHHRRGVEFIKDPVLTYLEPYASSTCELVTEVLSYMSDKINLTKFEAEALMAGITVDTKNFSFQTGVRTFEAASTLKRAGADTTVVRQLFRDDYNTFIYKAEVVRSSKIIFDKIAIGRLETQMEDSLLIAAQAANELLNINGVEASFVMTYVNNKLHISGRSLGNISVQLILESLGGGGHLTSAGTQLDNVTMDEAEIILTETIDKFLKEGEEE